MFNAGPVDVSKIKLTEHEGVITTLSIAVNGNILILNLFKKQQIYLPSPDYYTCEPLPAEWMQIIHEKI